VKLEGSLDTFPLRELIDMVMYSSVTGVLNIYVLGDTGYLYFRDSVLYHAERGSSTGVQALAELLEPSRGEFSFVSELVTTGDSLYGGVSMHLQTAERLAARWRQIRAYIPTLELIPHLVVAREAATRRLSPAHHAVLDVMDGRASLRQITDILGWAEVDVAEAAAQMSVDGLIDLRKPGQLGITPGGHEPTAPGEGMFDRILARAPHQPPRPVEGDPARATAPEGGARSGGEDLILHMLRGSG